MIKKIFLTSIIILLTSSCIVNQYPSSITTTESRVFIDGNVKFLRDVSVNKAETKGGIIKIAINGMNISLKNEKIFYKIDWFDSNGMPITSILSKWNELELIKQTPFSVIAVAPNDKASSYTITIKDNLSAKSEGKFNERKYN